MKIILSLVLIAVIITAAAAILVSQVKAAVQTNNKTIAGFNNNTAQSAIDNQSRLLNIAKLHNATFAQQTGFVTGVALFECIKTALTISNTSFSYNLDRLFLSNCDNAFTSAIVDRRSGNNTTLENLQYGLFGGYRISLANVNQTIINDVYSYLKSRGIQ